MSVGGLGWGASIISCLEGLKIGSLTNRSLEDERTYRQGRHHFETVMSQVTMIELAIEQMDTLLNAVNTKPLSGRWYWGAVAVSSGAAFISSYQIKVLRLAEIGNFIQHHSVKLSLLILATASIGLLIIGQTTLVGTTLAYLSLGVVERNNILPLNVQNFVRQSQFFIEVSSGIYLGGNFIRAISVLNLVTKIARYFGYKPSSEKNNETEFHVERVKVEGDVNHEEKDEEVRVKRGTISYQDLKDFKSEGKCSLSKSHVRRKPLPIVDQSVKIRDILDLADQIDWSKHESIIEKKLVKDNRWLEVEQFKSKPLPYFKKSLRNMVESIEKKNILTGKPISYEMLEFYCRFIGQQLKKEDEITQADMLIWLGVDAGDYCGAGLFGVVEEVYENLLLIADGLPLETRILASLQQERVRVWNSVYLYLVNSTSFIRFTGYFLDYNAVHTANMYKNMFSVGKKFGIPHQAAENDEIAIPPPFLNYMLSASDIAIQELFWGEVEGSTSYYKLGLADKRDWWKPWKWVHLKNKVFVEQPYTEMGVLEHLRITIGTPLIPKWNIYDWWRGWIDRQDLSEEDKEKLLEELAQSAGPDGVKEFCGECFELNEEIQPKFLRLMLIEMGVLEKPRGV